MFICVLLWLIYSFSSIDVAFSRKGIASWGVADSRESVVPNEKTLLTSDTSQNIGPAADRASVYQKRVLKRSVTEEANDVPVNCTLTDSGFNFTGPYESVSGDYLVRTEDGESYNLHRRMGAKRLERSVELTNFKSTDENGNICYFSNKTVKFGVPKDSELVKSGRYSHTKDGKRWFVRTTSGLNPIRYKVDCSSQGDDTFYYEASDGWHKVESPTIKFKRFLLKLPVMFTHFKSVYSDHRLVVSDDSAEWSVIGGDGVERNFLAYRTNDTDEELCLTVDNVDWMKFLQPPPEFIAFLNKKLGYEGPLYKGPKRTIDLTANDSGVKKMNVVNPSDNLTVIPIFGRYNSIVYSTDKNKWYVNLNGDYTSIISRLESRGQDKDMVYYKAPETWHKIKNPPKQFVKFMQKKVRKVFNGSTDFEDLYRANERLVASDQNGDWTIICEDGFEREFVGLGECDREDGMNLTTDDKQWYEFVVPPDDFVEFVHKRFNYSGWLYQIIHPEFHGERSKRSAPSEADVVVDNAEPSNSWSVSDKLVLSENGTQWSVRTDRGLKKVMYKVVGASMDEDAIFYEATDGWHKTRQAPKAFKAYLQTQVQVVKPYFKEMYWSNRRLVCSDDTGEWTVLCGDGIERDFIAMGRDHHYLINTTVDNKRWYLFRQPPDNFILFTNRKLNYTGLLYQAIVNDSLNNVSRPEYHYISNPRSSYNHSLLNATYKRQILSKRWLVMSEDRKRWFIDSDDGLKRTYGRVLGRAKDFKDAIFYEASDGWHKMKSAPKEFKEYLSQNAEVNPDFEDPVLSNHRLVLSDENGDWTVLCRDGTEREFIALNNDCKKDVLNLTADNGKYFRFLNPPAEFVRFVNEKFNYRGHLYQNLKPPSTEMKRKPIRKTGKRKPGQENQSDVYSMFDSTGRFVMRLDVCYVVTDNGDQRVRFRVQGQPKETNATLYEASDGWHKVRYPPIGLTKFLANLIYVKPDFRELFWSNRRLIVSDDDGSWTCLCRDGIERDLIALGPDRNDIINATVDHINWFRFRDPPANFVRFVHKKFNYTGTLYRWLMEEEAAVKRREKRDTQEKCDGIAEAERTKPRMTPVMNNDSSVRLVPSEDGKYWFSKCNDEVKMVRFKVEAHGNEKEAVFYEVSGGWRKTCKAPEAFKHYLNRLKVEKPNFLDLFSSNRRLVESDESGPWTVVCEDGQEKHFVGFSSDDKINTLYLTADLKHWFKFLKPPANFIKFVHDKFDYNGKLYKQLLSNKKVHTGLVMSADGDEWYLSTAYGELVVQARVDGTSTDNEAIFYEAGDKWHKTTKAPFRFKVHLSKLPIRNTGFEEVFWSNTRLVVSDDDGEWSVLCPDGLERHFVALEKDARDDVLNLTAGDNYSFRFLNPPDDFIRFVNRKFKYTGKLFHNLGDDGDEFLGKNIRLGIVDWTGRFVISEDGEHWSVQTDHGQMEIKYRIKGRAIEDDAVIYEATDGWHKSLMSPIMFKHHLSKLPVLTPDFRDGEWSNRRLVVSDEYGDWTILCMDGNEREFIAIGTDNSDTVNLTTDNIQWYQFKTPPDDFIRFLHKKFAYCGRLYTKLNDKKPDLPKSHYVNEGDKFVVSNNGTQWHVRTDSGLKLVRFRVRGKSMVAGSTIYEASDGWHKIAEPPESFKKYLSTQSTVKADFNELHWSNRRLVVSDDDGNWTVLCRDGIERGFIAVADDEREDTLNLTADYKTWYRFLNPPVDLVSYVHKTLGYNGSLYHSMHCNRTTVRTKRGVQSTSTTDRVATEARGQLVDDNQVWYVSTDEGLKRIVNKVKGKAKRNSDALFYEVHDGWHKTSDAPVAFKEFLSKQPVETPSQDDLEWSNHRLVESDDDGSWTVLCSDGLERDFVAINNDTRDDVLNLTADNNQCFRFLQPPPGFVLQANKKFNYSGKLFTALGNSSRMFKVFGHPIQLEDDTKWYVRTEVGLKMVRFKVEGVSKEKDGVFYDIMDGWRKNIKPPFEFKKFLNGLNSSRTITPDFNEQKWSNQRLVECDNDGSWTVLCKDGIERDLIGLSSDANSDVVNLTVGNSLWFQFHQPPNKFVNFLNTKFNYTGLLFKKLFEQSYQIIPDFNTKERGKNASGIRPSNDVKSHITRYERLNSSKPYASEWLSQSSDGKFVWYINTKSGRKKIKFRVAGIGIKKDTLFVGAEDGFWHKIIKAPPQFKEYIYSQVLVHPTFKDAEWLNKRLVISENGEEWSVLCHDGLEREFSILGVDESDDAFKIGLDFDGSVAWCRFKKSPLRFEEYIRKKFKLAHSDDGTVWYIHTGGGLKRILCKVVGEGIRKDALFFEATDGLWHKVTNTSVPFKDHLSSLSNKTVDVDEKGWDNRRLVISQDDGQWTALCSDGKEREFSGFVKNERLDVFNMLLSNKELFKVRNPPAEFIQFVYTTFLPVGKSSKKRRNNNWTLKKIDKLQEKKHKFQGGDRFEITEGGMVGSVRTMAGPKKILFRVHGHPKEKDALFFEASDGMHKVKQPPIELQNFLIQLSSMEPDFPDTWWANRRLVFSDDDEEWTFLRRDGIEQDFISMSSDIRSDVLNMTTGDGRWYRFRDPTDAFIRFVNDRFKYDGELYEEMVLRDVNNSRNSKTVDRVSTQGYESRRDKVNDGISGIKDPAPRTGDIKSVSGNASEVQTKAPTVLLKNTISVDEGLARLEFLVKKVKRIREKQDAKKSATTTTENAFRIEVKELRKKSDLFKGSEEQFFNETRISHEAFTTPASHRHNRIGSYTTMPPEYQTIYDLDANPYVHNLNYLLVPSEDDKEWFLRTVRGYMRIVSRVEGVPIEKGAVFVEAEDKWWYKMVRVPDEFREFLGNRSVVKPCFEDAPWSDRRLVVSDDGEKWTVLCRDGVERQFTALSMDDQYHMQVCAAGHWLTLNQPPKEFVKYIEANLNYTRH